MATTAVQSAPENCAKWRELTDNPSTETPAKVEFRNAGELLAEFDSLRNELETQALSGKEFHDKKVYPLLVRMQALRSWSPNLD
jgi:hypothetical protein